MYLTTCHVHSAVPLTTAEMVVLLVFLLAVVNDVVIAAQACCQSGYQCASDGSSTICQPGTMGGQLCSERLSCYDCGVGYYQSYAGQTFCPECPDGYQCSHERTITPFICPPGTRGGRNVSEKYTCYDCGAGYYQQSAGHVTCQHCPDGYMCPYARTTNPFQCLPGTRSGHSDEDRSQCYECGSGYYQQCSGQTSCAICPDGYSCPFANTSSPVRGFKCVYIVLDHRGVDGHACGVYMPQLLPRLRPYFRLVLVAGH
jgi:hypothetical protein